MEVHAFPPTSGRQRRVWYVIYDLALLEYVPIFFRPAANHTLIGR